MNQGGVDSSPLIIQLSEKSQRNLILMQIAMGAKDVDSAIDKMYGDFVLINSKKIRFDPNNAMSIGEVFVKVVKEYDSRVDIADLVRRVKNDDFQRNVMMLSLGIEEATFFLYQLGLSSGYRGTIIDYLNDAVKRDYLDLGWRFGEYYNSELKGYYQKVIDPHGKETLLPLKLP
jgi:copper chaperone CopZ